MTSSGSFSPSGGQKGEKGRGARVIDRTPVAMHSAWCGVNHDGPCGCRCNCGADEFNKLADEHMALRAERDALAAERDELRAENQAMRYKTRDILEREGSNYPECANGNCYCGGCVL